MAVDPATVSYLLSSIASTAKIIEFGMGLLRRPSEQEVDRVARAADASASLKFSASSPVVIAMGNGSLTQPIVEALIEKIKQIQARAISVIKSAMDDYDREKRLRDVRRNLCAHLAELRNWNGGQLPPDMEQEWNSMCHDYVP